jgi:uncharacterized surface protein with fasciclin (FAS1) repeats
MTTPAEEPNETPSLAEKELANARNDPRLAQGPEAMIADWWTAMHAAERVHKLGVWGVHELTLSLEREEARVGYIRGASDLPANHAPELEAAWERGELAKAEQDNDTVELNAMTLVAMVSALDAMVEQLVPGTQDMLTQHLAQQALDTLFGQDSDAFADIPAGQLDALKGAVTKAVRKGLPKIDRLYDVGAIRWERLLTAVGLQAPADRALPPDLDEALTEMVTLRHVLVHRAGRVDRRALAAAPSLRQSEGELVRLTRADYRRYSAALWTYGQEVIHRLMRDLADPVDLVRWRENYTIGA